MIEPEHEPDGRAGPDCVILAVAVVGLVSLLLSWLVVKENRLASGTSLRSWQALGTFGAAAVTLLWAACLWGAFLGRGEGSAAIAGLCSAAALVVSLYLAGGAAPGFRAETGEYARVAVGGGLWLTAGAAYLMIFTARRRLGSRPFWRRLVSWSAPSLVLLLLLAGHFSDLSIVQEFLARRGRFLAETRRHLVLLGVSVGAGALIGVPLGVWAARSGRSEKFIFFGTNITQTIPSLALFGLLIAPLSALSRQFPLLREMGVRGVGVTPAVIALALYSLLPIVRNTYTALRGIDPAVIDAGLGMGMSARQAFLKIEVPLAAPLVMEGLRTASVQAVGNAAVAALIGAGGLGSFIFDGIGEGAPALVLLGALPVVGLALAVDALMRLGIGLATPEGIREDGR